MFITEFEKREEEERGDGGRTEERSRALSCRPQIRRDLKEWSGFCIGLFSVGGIMQCRVTRREEEEEITVGEDARTDENETRVRWEEMNPKMGAEMTSE